MLAAAVQVVLPLYPSLASIGDGLAMASVVLFPKGHLNCKVAADDARHAK